MSEQTNLQWLRAAIASAGEGGCVEWPFYRDRDGYGHVHVRGQMRGAHRTALRMVSHPPTPDAHVLHSCDNPPCVNPHHLHWGTAKRNMREASERGLLRPRYGEANGRAKLTWADVRNIRQQHAAGVTKSSLARKYGVRWNTVADVCAGRSWKDDE